MMKLFILAILLTMQAPSAPARPGTISGRLQTKDGKPAAGVRVTALTADEALAAQTLMSLAQTDQDGQYQLENVPPGRYLVAAGPLESPSYFPAGLARAGAAVVTVTAGATITAIDFRLAVAQPMRLAGRVVHDAATPQPSSLVRLSATGAARAAQTARAGVDGQFEFQNVPPGTYRLTLPNAHDVSVVLEDRDITGLELRVRASIMVRHTVAVEDGGPLPTFDLLLTDLASGAVSSIPAATTAGLNATLLTGEYRVETRGLPPGVFVKSMTSGTRDLLKQPLLVTSSGPPAEFAITLGVTWVSLSGRVTGPGAASVTRLAATTGTLREAPLAVVQKDGSFVFPKLIPGRYTIAAFPDTFPLPTKVDVDVREGASVEIAVPAIKQAPGHVRLEGSGPMPLNIALDIRCPRAGAATESSVRLTVPLELDGSFVASLPADGCRVALPALTGPGTSADTYSRKAFSYGSTDLAVEAPPVFTFVDSEEFKITLGTPSKTVAVKGSLGANDPAVRRIVFRSGGVLASVQGQQAPVDANGRFEINLPSGSYRAFPDAGSVIPVPEISVVLAGDEAIGAIGWPRFRTVVVRALTEGGTPPETFVLRIGGIVGRGQPGDKVSPEQEYRGYSVDVTPSPEGTFAFVLPEGRYWFGVGFPEGAPARYTVKSFSAGGVDLNAANLSISGKDSEITVVFEGKPR